MSQEKKKVENEPGSVGDEESDILRVEKRNERKKYDEDGKFIDEARSKAGKEENGGSVRCLREIVDVKRLIFIFILTSKRHTLLPVKSHN